MKYIPILIKPMKKRDEAELLELEKQRAFVISNLKNMLEECIIPDKRTKHGLMGPAGKLLNKINSTKDVDWGKMTGYISNVIRNNQKHISTVALNSLEEACNELKKVKEKLTKIEWLNLIDGIDNELFFQLYKEQSEFKEDYVKKKFQEFLKEKYSSDLSSINDVLGVKFESLEKIPHPNEIDNKEIIDEFWNSYKTQKEAKN